MKKLAKKALTGPWQNYIDRPGSGSGPSRYLLARIDSYSYRPSLRCAIGPERIGPNRSGFGLYYTYKSQIPIVLSSSAKSIRTSPLELSRTACFSRELREDVLSRRPCWNATIWMLLHSRLKPHTCDQCENDFLLPCNPKNRITRFYY